jgi:dienelactone hydrolase
LTTRWAAAGFVVAAPAYPGTSAHAKQLDVLDIANQPADASTVIDGVLAAEPVAGHVDPQRIGAAGHSAGGYTTVGMFTSHRDPRLRAGIVLAGGPLGGAFRGAATPVLFVHGDKDPTVTYATGRSVYDALGWPKAFMTLIGADHLGYLGPGDRPFDAAVTTTIDFLRWALYGDPAAKSRLHGDATVGGVSRLDSTL